MYGVGYPVLENAAEGKYAAAFLLLLLAGKILATSLTIGIGGSGGVFAPSLFIGAMLGAAYGAGMQALLPGTAGAVGAYALVGMGAVFAGASRAPITAVVILFELTGEYSIILPLMLAIVTATATSRLLSRDTVYTLKLRRRGHRPGRPGPRRPARRPAGRRGDGAGARQRCAVDTELSAAAAMLSLSAHGVLPVADKNGHYVGMITARAVAEALADDARLRRIRRARRGPGGAACLHSRPTSHWPRPCTPCSPIPAPACPSSIPSGRPGGLAHASERTARRCILGRGRSWNLHRRKEGGSQPFRAVQGLNGGFLGRRHETGTERRWRRPAVLPGRGRGQRRKDPCA